MSDFCATCSGNFINSLLALAKSIKNEQGNIVFLFPLKEDNTECNWTEYIRNHGYTVIMYDRSASNDILTKQLFDIIDKYNIKLIHSHFSCMDTILKWNLELHKKVRILYHDHMDYVAEQPIKPQLKQQRKTAKRYREYELGVISVMKKKHRRYFGVPNRWYIPNGITYTRNVDYSMTREEYRNLLGLKSDEKLCLFLGWDIYRKGLDIAIKSVQKARSQGHNISLGIIGFGENPSKEQLDKIQSIIGFSPLMDGVRFLPSCEDMYALHRASDVFLSASRTEAFAYAILEAISQNVPIVASDISGTKWCLKYSKSFKFPSEDVDKCAELIIKASEIRDKPSNKDKLTKKFNIDIWCKRVINVYNKMLKS